MLPLTSWQPPQPPFPTDATDLYAVLYKHFHSSALAGGLSDKESIGAADSVAKIWHERIQYQIRVNQAPHGLSNAAKAWCLAEAAGGDSDEVPEQVAKPAPMQEETGLLRGASHAPRRGAGAPGAT